MNTHCPVFRVNEPRCTLKPKSSLQVMFGRPQMLLGRKMYAYTVVAQFSSTLDIYWKESRTFTCALRPPHNPCAEAVTAIGLAATGAAVDGRTPSQTRQLPSLDPIETLVKRNLVRQQHRLQGRRGVPQIIELRSTSVV